MFNFSCGCCSKGVDWDASDINFATTIFPKDKVPREERIKNLGMKQSPLYIPNIENKDLEKLYSKNNLLISYGNVFYEKNLDLNELTQKKEDHKLNVKKIVSSDLHSLMLIEIFDENLNLINTYVYAYGSNVNGQLGLDYDPSGNNFYSNWTKVDLDKKINTKNINYFVEDISVGDDFSIILIKDIDKNISLMLRFQLSKEDQFDILTNFSNKHNNKNLIKNCIKREKFNTDENQGIKQVECFGNRILVLTNDNSLYMKGILYDMSTMLEYKKCVQFKNDILYFTMGINNCLLLSEDNTIYALGHNEYKEFGISNIEEQLNDYLTDIIVKKNIINNDSSFNNGNRNIIKTNNMINHNFNEKVFVNNFFKDKGLTIKKISTGARHTMVLCTNGELYCFGDNSDGQCSGFEKVIDEPTLIEFEDEDEFIIDIKAGFNHSIAKGISNKVYVWGDSTWGKIGIKQSTADQFDPLEISDMKIRNVINMFAGPMHSGFFTSGDFNLDN